MFYNPVLDTFSESMAQQGSARVSEKNHSVLPFLPGHMTLSRRIEECSDNPTHSATTLNMLSLNLCCRELGERRELYVSQQKMCDHKFFLVNLTHQWYILKNVAIQTLQCLR